MISFAFTTSARSPAVIVCAVVLLVALLRVWPMTWRQWHDGRRLEWRGRDYTADQRADLERGMPVAAAGLTALLVLVAFVALLSGTAYTVAVLAAGVVFFGSGVLLFTVYTFHRPHWAISPVMRDAAFADPGMEAFVSQWSRLLRQLNRALRSSHASFGRTEALLSRDRLNGDQLATGFDRAAAPLGDVSRRLAEIEVPGAVAEPVGRLRAAIADTLRESELAAAAARAGAWSELDDLPARRMEKLLEVERAIRAVEAAASDEGVSRHPRAAEGPSAISRA